MRPVFRYRQDLTGTQQVDTLEHSLVGKGIGVDQLPASIRNSGILTGNNLGRLGNVAALPKEEEISSLRKDPKIQALLADVNGAQAALHRLAQKWLEEGEIERALGVLMLADKER